MSEQFKYDFRYIMMWEQDIPMLIFSKKVLDSRIAQSNLSSFSVKLELVIPPLNYFDFYLNICINARLHAFSVAFAKICFEKLIFWVQCF